MGSNESSQCSFENKKYWGMIVVVVGTIIVRIIKENTRFFPLKFIRANGNATSELESNVPNVFPTISSNVFLV